MDAIVTAQILRAAGLVAQKMDSLADKLDTVASKQDQLISREIKAAYSALQDFLLSSNPSTKERRLGFAEDNLLKNTKLNLNLETEGVPNRDLVGHAYYGLAYISFLRDDEGIAARHLLQAFEVAPRLGREVLAPQLYEKLFMPQCRQIIRDYKKKVDSLEKVGTHREMTTVAEHFAYWVSLPFGENIKIVSQEDYDCGVAYVEGERDDAIDERCSEIARELLGS